MNVFNAVTDNITFYNAHVVKDFIFTFTSDFTDDTSSYFLTIYDERSGNIIKDFTTQLTRSSDSLYLNASVSDMTFDDLGKYYYEIGYVRSGGYEEILQYGTATVI